MRILREILITLILAVIIFFVLQNAIQRSPVVGISMEPSFKDGQQLIVNKAVYHFRDPERGEVIILHPSTNPEMSYIKRVIGIPGDTLEVKNGAVYVNGVKLDEPYIKEPPAYTFEEERIPANEYFVLGDNRNNSNDSHNDWTVPRQNMVGKAWLSIWPADTWGPIPNYPLEEQLSDSTQKQSTIFVEVATWQ